MHERFDDELKKRLVNYRERPERDLWQGIAPHIAPTSLRPPRVEWSPRLVRALIVLLMLVPISGDEEIKQSGDGHGLMSFDNSIVQNPLTPAPIGELQEAELAALCEDCAHSVVKRSSQRQLPARSVDASYDEVVEEEDTPVAAHKSDSLFKDKLASDSYSYLTFPSDTTRNLTQDDVVLSDTNRHQLSLQDLTLLERSQRFSLYFTAMPTFGYQRIASNIRDNIWIQSIRKVPAFSVDRLGIRMEFGGEFYFSARWRIFAGLLYYQRKQTIEYMERHFGNLIVDVAPSELDVAPSVTHVSKSFEHELRNAGFQIGLIYQLGETSRGPTHGAVPFLFEKKAKRNSVVHMVGSGVEFHKSLIPISTTIKNEGFDDPSAYVFFNVYYRLQYPRTGKLKAVFQPTLNYSFYVSENLNAPFYVKPYLLGLNFGCIYTP